MIRISEPATLTPLANRESVASIIADQQQSRTGSVNLKYLIRLVALIAVLLIASMVPVESSGQVVADSTGQLNSFGFPSLTLSQNDNDYSAPIQVLLLLTVLSLAPAIIILMTSFTRLVVVLGILRQGLGMQQSPPSQVMIGLALFLTLFVMYPVFEQINEEALQPYMNNVIGQREATEKAIRPLRHFMLSQTRDKDLSLFMDLAQVGMFDSADSVPLHVLVPAFVISELRIAFQIGFLVFLPFLVVDLVVASVLMSMGMMMLPPVMISLPIKLLLFVLADGWYLLVESLMTAYLG